MKFRWYCAAALVLTLSGALHAEMVPGSGPYDVRFVPGGIGTGGELPENSSLLNADAPFSIIGWIKLDAIDGATTIIAMDEGKRALSIDRSGRLTLVTGTTQARSTGRVALGKWSHLAVVASGRRAEFFVDGEPAGSGPAAPIAVGRKVAVAPVAEGRPHLAATLVGFGIDNAPLSRAQVAAAAASPPDFAAAHIWEVGRGWDFQSKANIGLTRPQDGWTLPRAKASPTKPVASPAMQQPAVAPIAPGRWQINGWSLAAAPTVRQAGAELSRPGQPSSGEWHQAKVPGTVLQTLVARGIYPDPYYGLNNMAIPESLARQDYWYRTQFEIPAEAASKRVTLVFNGVNYAGEVWVNGERLGGTKGAFIRGRFAFDPKPGINSIAIRVSPPPHPGIPHEESIAAGPGENGGQMAIDGPTFVATEGWDWIPGIRDRNTGLWQNVELEASGAFELGDPQVVTDLPLPRTDTADIYITVPVTNRASTTQTATVSAAFEGVTVSRQVQVEAGATAQVRFDPSTDRQLRVANPRLWWPNGYGEPTLHTMAIRVASAEGVSASRDLRFGIREVSYDLGLMRDNGRLERVNVQTTDGALAGARLIDVAHDKIWQTPKGYVESLTPAGNRSPAVTPVTDYTIPEPHLALRINGVKIAARGGNWGMDDAMKQVSRARLEPYFRLQRDASMNVIRNWMGTNTEPEFYELADEYGMMVFNDFWQSTQNFQIEPQDPQLFLQNARDTIARYRNHPSIVLWFGRNEGVPYPLLNEGLDDAVFELDGTRWFTGSSNVVNLQYSGPYNYRPPQDYYTKLATGFSVETGTPSLATLESIEATVPPQDRWPISDTLAYHDWHFGGNGDVATFMATLARRFGEGTSLADFERKAQMLNIETYKAMFEGLFAGLWTQHTGRLLWMTHPAWPSNHWQIYSWDYDTHGAYYGVRTATEPLHVQLNLNDDRVAVINTTREPARGLSALTRVLALDGRELWQRRDRLDAAANATATLGAVPLASMFAANPMMLVEQTLTRADGSRLSRNFYWRGRDDSAFLALNDMPSADLDVRMERRAGANGDRRLAVTVHNPGPTPALAAKLTLVDAQGERILPAFYSDNYVSLLPGQTETVIIDWPATTPNGAATPETAGLRIRGWNVTAEQVP